MTTVKKDFEQVYNLLMANQNKKVSTIMDQVLELMAKKSGDKTFFTDEEGKVQIIYCYYHKKFEVVTEVEYGAKASSASGLNTMCKEGVSAWTKQQRAKKKAQEDLLSRVASGEELDLQVALADIETEAKAIKPRADQHGSFDSLEEAWAFVNS